MTDVEFPTADQPLRVLHVITGLGLGGAEAGLVTLLRAASGAQSAVIGLGRQDERRRAIESLGVPVTVLAMPAGRITLNGVRAARRLARAFAPHVIQTWMLHADLFSSLFIRSAPIVWGLHAPPLDPALVGVRTRLVHRAGARLSRVIPRTIISCSSVAARWHQQQLGYEAGRMVVVPNGCDTERFRRKTQGALALRAALGIDQDTPLMGMVARSNPQKDTGTFLRALARVRAAGVPAVGLLAGLGQDSANARLFAQVDALQLTPHCHLLGQRSDIDAVMSALDVHVMSSVGEAFPYAVLEAMACETPCVVTDVGDMREMVGGTGRVVPPSDPDALADAAIGLLALDQTHRRTLGAAARERVVVHYSAQNMARGYMRVWLKAAGRIEVAAGVAPGDPEPVGQASQSNPESETFVRP